MPIVTFPLGPLETNCYLIHNESTALAVDVGGDPADVLDYLTQHKLCLSHILITHLHFDHLYGVAALQEATHAVVLCPAGDDCLRGTSLADGGQWGLPTVPPFASQNFTLGEQTIGGFVLSIFETPGHTPGSVSLYMPQEKAVFTGDALFYHSMGRTDFPGGDQATLLHSIRTRLFTLPEETLAYPGHGPETSIGNEKRNNPYCGDFVHNTEL
ncbi:MAG: MBL fold metallo-hydrolase [Desulfovibrionaceae bacterium]|nr:MBL fold metallo-hydrolase [Desulfovibrionaceae bacterium]